METIVHFCFIFAFSIINLGILPFIVYYWIHFKKRMDSPVIKRRHASLVRIINYLLMFLIVNRPIAYVAQSPLLHHRYQTWRILMLWTSITSIICTYGLLLFFFARFWIMYYELNYSWSLMNKQWKAHLNAALIKKDFFLKFKQTLGSPQHITKVTWFIFAALVLLAVSFKIRAFWICNDSDCAMNASPAFTKYLSFAVHTLALTVLLVLQCRFPKLIDVWYLGFELRYLNIALLVTYPLVMFSVLIHALFRKHASDHVYYIVVYTRLTFVVLTWTMAVIVSTYVVLCKVEEDLDQMKQRKIVKSKSNSSDSSEDIDPHSMPKLTMVLNNEPNFMLFVHHLCRECAAEMILCFIELMQFKTLVQSAFSLQPQCAQLTDSAVVDVQNDYFHFEECREAMDENKCIPKSQLVHSGHIRDETDERRTERFLTVAHSLYCKYLRVGAELEINISGESRRQYFEDMNDLQTLLDERKEMEPIELFELFDEVLEEMYNLMLLSLQRFVSSTSKTKIKELFLSFSSIQIDHVRVRNNSEQIELIAGSPTTS